MNFFSINFKLNSSKENKYLSKFVKKNYNIIIFLIFSKARYKLFWLEFIS